MDLDGHPEIEYYLGLRPGCLIRLAKFYDSKSFTENYISENDDESQKLTD